MSENSAPTVEPTAAQEPAIVYRKVDERQYWGLPDRDLTQDDLDTFTPSQHRELLHAAGYQKVETVNLMALSRQELESRAEAAGIVGPYSRFRNKEALVEALTNGEPPPTNPETVGTAQGGGDQPPQEEGA